MLIQFSVKNFRSIKNEVVLSMAKANGDELVEQNSFVPDAPSSVPLLRSAAIYGANAAGKSNVISAITAMTAIILRSAKQQQGDELDLTPFLFDDEAADAPTEFEVNFIYDNIRYQYGFSATNERIMEEWLFAYPKGRPQRWFARAFDKVGNCDSYKFGDSFLGSKSVWQNATRDNALFLSTAIQLNNDQLKPVFNWFKHKVTFTGPSGWNEGFTAKQCDDNKNKARIVSFLQAADFAIHDIEINKEKFDPKRLPKEIPDDLKNKIGKDLANEVITEIKTVHKTASGKMVALDLEQGSDGTQKLFSFAGPWIDTLNNGDIFIIDELHDSLHPKMVEYLVKLFHNKQTNPHNAQLIFTTHETSILNQNIFRRDQIWFCEKNNQQATELYPLMDFSPRKDRENIELAYLSGRYGALPFLSEFNLDGAE